MTQHEGAVLQRVEAPEVKGRVAAGDASLAVVDVRDPEEFAAGHVKGALNLAAASFTNTDLVDKLVEQLAPKEQVVVHCAKSLQRGPAAAAALKARLVELGIDKQVVVMDGGFDKFGALYKDDPAVVEGSQGGAAAAAASGGGAAH